jgi:hypothetical protein
MFFDFNRSKESRNEEDCKQDVRHLRHYFERALQLKPEST